VYTFLAGRTVFQGIRAANKINNEIEIHHPGYLVAQDTFYVGYIKGVDRIYQQTAIDTYARVAFGKLYTAKIPITAADALNEKVPPFLEDHQVTIMGMLTDRGTEFCGSAEKHPYELFLQYHEIEHSKIKVRPPKTNGACEALHKTVLNEFYRITFRKKLYQSLQELQSDLDDWFDEYNHERTHQGKRYWDTNFTRRFDTCQV